MSVEQKAPKRRMTHGSGLFCATDFRLCGLDVVIEPGVLVFHAENIELGEGVYVGHQTILKAYYRNLMQIGDGTWIGQQCFFHSAGGILIGRNVGIGPCVRIITSSHEEEGRRRPILLSRIRYAPVVIEDDSDIGVGSILMPGVTIGCGAQVGAGSVVTKSVEPYSVVAGVPARRLRSR